MRIYRKLALAVSVLVLCGIQVSKLWSSDNKVSPEQVNRAYYNLKDKGLTEFNCQVVPDFDSAYKNIQMDAVGRDQVLPAARKIHFQVAVGPSGAASVSHQFGDAPPTEEVAARLRQVADGMEQMVSGFFQTWSNITINSLLSGPENAYQEEEVADGFRFTTNTENNHVVVSMSRDLVINLMEVHTEKFEGTLRPHFTLRSDGLLLNSYEATYKTANNAARQMSAKIQYQEVDGLTLPQTVILSVPLPQGQLEAPITFTNCQVKKK